MPRLLCNNTLSFSSSSLDAVSFNAFSSSWSLALTPEQSFSAAFSRSVSVFFSVSLLRNCWLTSSSRLDQTPSVSLYKKENREDQSFFPHKGVLSPPHMNQSLPVYYDLHLSALQFLHLFLQFATFCHCCSFGLFSCIQFDNIVWQFIFHDGDFLAETVEFSRGNSLSPLMAK